MMSIGCRAGTFPAIALALIVTACGHDPLPEDWASVETTDDCSWIDGAYEAQGHKVDDAGARDAPATIPLFTTVLPGLIDRVTVDYHALDKVERVEFSWAPVEGELRITPVGGDLKPEVLDYACDGGHLVLHLAGPTVEKDWVGVGGEDIELWRDGEGGLVARRSSRAAFAAFMLVPMAYGDTRYYRFSRLSTAGLP